VSITAKTPGSRVFIDGAPVGTAPLRSHRVPVGRHELRVVAPDGTAASRTVTVDVGKNAVAQF
jgi:hypothetical protein